MALLAASSTFTLYSLSTAFSAALEDVEVDGFVDDDIGSFLLFDLTLSFFSLFFSLSEMCKQIPVHTTESRP